MSNTRKRWRTAWKQLVLAAVVAITTVLPLGLTPSTWAKVAEHVVISEIYGAGGNSGARFQHDYIALYNPSGQAVPVNNWSVQYAAADKENWLVTKLSGSISAHSYYLVRLASGGAVGAALPAADATGSTNISATQGKVALVNHTTALTGNPVGDPAVVDFVGYGKANAYEGASPAPAPSATKSIVRKSNATGVIPGKGNAWDSDNNGDDFLLSEPQPKNSQSPAEPPGEGSGEPGEEWPEAQPISEVRLAASGTLAAVEGIVTAFFETGGKTNVFLQDESAGMVIRASGLGQIVQIGDKLKAKGRVNDYYGLPQLEPAKASDVAITQKQAGVPTPKQIISTDFAADNGEQYEAELVTIRNVKAESRDSKGNVTLSDSFGTFLAKPYDASLLKPGAVYESLTGVMTYDFNEYKLIPRFAEDVIGEGGGQPEALRIHDIQGRSHRSPYEGANVSGVEGIVTAVVKSGSSTAGFYMQDPQPDDDPFTSEGIYVYKPSAAVRPGDLVEVSGVVKEYVSKSREATDLTLTEIEATGITVKMRDLPLPEPVILGEDGYRYPTKTIDSDSFSVFNPDVDGIDFWESLEGMLVQVNNPRVVGVTKTFSNPPSVEFVIVSDDADPDKVRTPSGGLPITADNYNPERITVGDRLVAGAPNVKVGDTFDGPIVGIIDYSFANFKLYNIAPLPAPIDGGFERQVTTLTPKEDRLTIATYNIENFSARDTPQKINGLAQSIVHNLKQPDIIAVVEMQDNNGPQDNGVTDASQSAQALIDAISRAGGQPYRYVDIAPEDKRDGGQPGGNIRVGFLYNPERVKLADRPAGDAVTAVRVEAEAGKAHLSHNPGRIDPLHPAFTDSRKPLAAEFLFHDQSVIVIANHFNSKGGDSPLYGNQQPPVLVSELQRVEIAKVVNGFVKEIQAADPKANVVVLGDLNDFPFSLPLRTLEGKELINLVGELPLGEQYTYNYQGNAQVLDQILVSNHLADRAKVEIVHINADFTEAHGRVSDHDPVLAQLALADNSGPSPGEGTLEKQRALNLAAAKKIRVSTDEASILEEVDLVVKSLQKLIRAEEITASDKWSAISHTITTVLGATVEQADQGIVKESTLARLITDFLKDVFEPAIRSTDLTDRVAGRQALVALDDLLKTAVLPLDVGERTRELAAELSSVAETLLAAGGTLHVERGDLIRVTDPQAEIVLSVLGALAEALEEHAGQVWFEPTLSIRVKDAGDQAAEAAVTLSAEVMSRLADSKAAVKAEWSSGAWVLLSEEVINRYGDEELGITLESVDSPESASNVKPASGVYEWVLLVDGKRVQSMDNGEALLGIPVEADATRNLNVFTYSGNKWEKLTDKKGNPVRITWTKNTAVFSTAHTGFLVIGEEKQQEETPKVRTLIFNENHFMLKPGEEAQIQVTANLGNGGKVDVTHDDEIRYESADPELVSVSPTGEIRVSDTAKEKDRTQIAISYGGKTATIKVTVKKR
ncbi:lamin tail domain-containing protein [Brevibacillus ruminantium]|uniref:Lamin tail domain-containing protein n=1 Tax=Brevibacillus ruminantium TaxID=2950604 RepID=A0ABY4WC63_9BACL|nr:endonuclease/exonuclease/phosphatase family protein [Brevibacillus ruminantium]USG64494.1 lamin tail domain-containing protein [Brevibacillus ruminantium]